MGSAFLKAEQMGGPVTRSKGTPVQPISASYASVVKNKKINLHPEMFTKVHTQAQNESEAQTKVNLGEGRIKNEAFLGAIKTDLLKLNELMKPFRI